MVPNSPAPHGPAEDRGLDELYSDAILDHARSPRHSTPLDEPNCEGDAVNPFCGDESHVQIALSGVTGGTGRRITGFGIQTVGCSINRASGSMIAEALSGASLSDAEALAADYRALMTGEPLTPERMAALGDLVLMGGVRRFPVRIKCAMLAITSLEEALAVVEK